MSGGHESRGKEHKKRHIGVLSVPPEGGQVYPYSYRCIPLIGEGKLHIARSISDTRAGKKDAFPEGMGALKLRQAVSVQTGALTSGVGFINNKDVAGRERNGRYGTLQREKNKAETKSARAFAKNPSRRKH